MKNSGFTRLLRSLAKYRLLIIGMLLSSAVGNTMLLLAPRHIAKAIDLIAPLNGDYSLLLQELVILGALYVSGGIFTWLSMVLANSAANRTVRDLRNQLFEKLARLPLGYFDNNPRGDMISRFTNDINAISDGLNQGVIQLVSGIITVVLSLVFMLTLNPYVTLVAVFVMPISFLIGFSITKYGKSKFKEQSRVLGQLNGYAEETISSHHTVKAFGYEKAADTRFGEINRQLYECGYRAQFASALVNPSTRFVNNIAYVLVGVLGIIAVLRNTLTVGGVAGFLTYTAQFSKPFNEITAVTMQLQLAMASARRVFGLLDEEELRQSTVSENLPGGLGLVEFKDVCFSYQPETPLIKNLNLSVRPGETIAIVGPTGAGKTTLVNLLMRFYEIDSGSILIGGEDITSLTRESLRRSFGMVLQDTWLFSGTVRDNIAYGKPKAIDIEIEQAARAAHAHSFIRRLPDGYNTPITEDGGNLSQGQKQLLTIARAMLLDPPMLILDEATSSVDIVTEIRIQRAFRKLMQGKTTFIIAHRLSTIRDADRILVLNQGDVVEQGSHSELLGLGGFYSRLYQSQFAPSE
ncbi:MAG TPA: sugar ABC transporter ATP-binding protein [Ruminococcaceae bacterium]|mgnify:FL=1|nr:sugar ABC transporter ATP-binding protein [Oscillospiraceae bacterium]